MGGSPKPAKQTQNTTTSSTPTPYSPAEPLLQDMLARAQQAQAQTPTTPVFSGPNANQTAANDYLLKFAPSAGAGASSVLDNAQKTASGFYLNPTNSRAAAGSGYTESINPGLEAMIKAAINPLRDQLDANVLSIGDAAKMAGAYGGDRGDLLKGTALARFDRDAMDVGAGYSFNAQEAMQNRLFQANQNDFSVAAQAEQAERARMGEVAAQFEAANRLGMEPARIQAGVGDTQQQWDIARAQAAIDAPWAGLDRYATILDSVSPYASTSGTTNTVATGTPARASGLAGAASGALGGASAGAAFGPWGAGIGAVVGGLGGLFG